MATWSVDRSRILTRNEIQAVLADLSRRARRSRLTRRNLIIFRLATCCGLRVGELTRLELRDLQLERDRPCLVVRAENSKGRRRRTVPLWWDAGTLHDLVEWVAAQRALGATDNDLVVATRRKTPIDCAAARRAFQSACRILKRHTTIHDGRHSYASHAIAGGRTLVEVRDALGHKNLATTSLYSHLMGDDGARVGSLFGPENTQRDFSSEKAPFDSQRVTAIDRSPQEVGLYLGGFQFSVSLAW
jgi:integrase/recombinase XerD